MKKKILITLSIIIIAFNLVACGEKNVQDKDTDSNLSSQNDATNEKNPNSSLDKDSNNSSNKNNSNTPSTPTDKPIKGNTDNNTALEENTTEKDCRIFYYDFANEQMIYVNKKIEIIDGALTTALTKELQDTTINPGFLTLDADAAVTSAKLDKSNDTLHVYFNTKFNEINNLGTIAQCELVNSIVYSFGYNFDVATVKLYVNGKPFTDSRGEMPEGYTVDTSNTIQFK